MKSRGKCLKTSYSRNMYYYIISNLKCKQNDRTVSVTDDDVKSSSRDKHLACLHSASNRSKLVTRLQNTYDYCTLDSLLLSHSNSCLFDDV